jgi:hypothetical protein
MQLTTPVELPSKAVSIHPNTQILFLGSCFASKIGERMQQNALCAEVNPFGTLYNPASIAACLKAIMNERIEEDWFYQGTDAGWHSILHSTLFSAKSLQECRENVNLRMTQAIDFFKGLDVLVVTMGTADVFERNGVVVSNCHKQPSKMFTQRRLQVREIVEQWQDVLTQLWSCEPEVRVIMTVSPYRYLKKGLHDNQISKSILLLAIAELQGWDERILYFPAYEIVMDELRDYRFYAPDMQHVTDQTADYIWERFTAWCFDAVTFTYCKNWMSIFKDLHHRPQYPDSAEAKLFKVRAEERKNLFLSQLSNFHQQIIKQHI